MVNEVIIQGRLCHDLILRYTASANPKAICEFDIAHQEGYGDNASTNFIKAVAWEGTAEFVHRNFKKGEMMVITGSLQNKPFVDREGKTRNDYKVKVREVSFCGNGKGE